MMDGPRQLVPDSKSLSIEEINERLHRKRKTRNRKACYPCRQRKVGCNYEAPCQKCIERNHPELCVYDPVSQKHQLDALAGDHFQAKSSPKPPSRGTTLEEIGERLSSIEQSIQELRNDLAYIPANNSFPAVAAGRSSRDPTLRDSSSEVPERNAPGMHPSNQITGEAIHLGHHSVPAMVVALGSEQKEDIIQDLIGKSILPYFGLDNESVTYPFVDLWGLPHASYPRISALCKLIPSDADCLQYFGQYRDTAHVLFPGVVDISQFEHDLTNFIIKRAASGSDTEFEVLNDQNVWGKTIHWIGLLFSILASGCQTSSLPRKERQLTSQVYVCCAYECLRIINYLSNANILDIENLLVLGNVISNNMNAGVTWSLLGLTIRLGQSLGLHRETPPSSSTRDGLLRKEVWWRIVWQDSLISISYDRGSSTVNNWLQETSDPSESMNLSYVDCMKILCKTGLQIVQERNEHGKARNELTQLERHWNMLSTMMTQSMPHLQDSPACRSMKDQLEYWNFYLHRSYIIAELFRPALKRTSRRGAHAMMSKFHQLCIENLTNTVDAFLGLHNVTRFAIHSWAAVHRALSSALLLAILKQPERDQRVRLLLERLIAVMLSATSSLDPNEASAPISRSLSAISRLISRPGSDTGFNQASDSTSFSVLDWSGNPDVAMLDGPRSTEASGSDTKSQGSPWEMMERILWGVADS